MKKYKKYYLTSNKRIIRFFHYAYHKLVGLGWYSSSKNDIYDHLGAIDTLGSRSSASRYTFSYSTELCYVRYIKLPFGWSVMCVDAEEKELYLTNEPLTIY